MFTKQRNSPNGLALASIFHENSTMNIAPQMPSSTPADLRHEIGSFRKAAAISITISGLVAEINET